MKRLTYRSLVLHNAVSYGACEGVECCRDCENCKIGAIISKLCAYEDTGLEPEEVTALRESNQELKKEAMPLLQAKIQDRMIVLPCKVTDTVYIAEGIYRQGKLAEDMIVPAQIEHVIIGRTGKPIFDLCAKTGNWHYSVKQEKFYLTREAAETALKEQEGKQC